MSTSTDLLFGLLALQTGLIQQAQLVAAFHAWTCDRSRSLADHLIALGHFSAAQKAVVEALAEIHVEAHSGNVERVSLTFRSENSPAKVWPSSAIPTSMRPSAMSDRVRVRPSTMASSMATAPSITRSARLPALASDFACCGHMRVAG